MMVTFQDILLDTSLEDNRAVLVLREGRVAAVLTHLSEMHEDMAGMWFVEALFTDSPAKPEHLFTDPTEFSAWLDRKDL